jgi:hypothetical protein
MLNLPVTIIEGIWRKATELLQIARAIVTATEKTQKHECY